MTLQALSSLPGPYLILDYIHLLCLTEMLALCSAVGWCRVLDKRLILRGQVYLDISTTRGPQSLGR